MKSSKRCVTVFSVAWRWRTSSIRNRRKRCTQSGDLLDEDAVEEIERLGIDEVRVRTPLTCETPLRPVRSLLWPRPGPRLAVNVGEAVGVIAAQSIGEPGTQLTMRTFHIGGAASRAAVASSVEAKSNRYGALRATMRYVTNAKGEQVAISRSGEAIIADDLRSRA